MYQAVGKIVLTNLFGFQPFCYQISLKKAWGKCIVYEKVALKGFLTENLFYINMSIIFIFPLISSGIKKIINVTKIIILDALRDLVPLVKLKRREKHPWVFFTFFIGQIVPNRANHHI